MALTIQHAPSLRVTRSVIKTPTKDNFNNNKPKLPSGVLEPCSRNLGTRSIEAPPRYQKITRHLIILSFKEVVKIIIFNRYLHDNLSASFGHIGM